MKHYEAQEIIELITEINNSVELIKKEHKKIRADQEEIRSMLNNICKNKPIPPSQPLD